MIKYLILIAFSTSSLLSGPGDCPGLAGTPRNQLAGTWSLVAVENTGADGQITYPYGRHPAGMMILTTGGDYAIQILKAGRPCVTAESKAEATPAENAALVSGCNAHFGRYIADPLGGLITFDVRHAFYPNWEGHLQIRAYTLKDNELTYVVNNTTSGGAVKARVVWRKKNK